METLLHELSDYKRCLGEKYSTVWVLEMTLELCEYNEKNSLNVNFKMMEFVELKAPARKLLHLFCSIYLVPNFLLSSYLLPIDQ